MARNGSLDAGQVNSGEPGWAALLPATIRPLAAALFAVCVAMTVILGALVTHKTRAGWLDTAVEARVRSSLGSEPGDPEPAGPAG